MYFVSRCRLWINATCGAAEAIPVELLGNNGRTLTGYPMALCRPLTGDGIGLRVRWAEKHEIPDTEPFRIRIHLNGQEARLYAFGFDPPRP